MHRSSIFSAVLFSLLVISTHALSFTPVPWLRQVWGRGTDLSNGGITSELVTKRGTTGTINGSFPCPPSKPPTSNLSITDPSFVCLQMPPIEEVDNDPNKTKSKRDEVSQLTKRVDGTIREIFNTAQKKVPTNGGDIIFWRDGSDQTVQTDRAIATEDLCGCTVVVVASPYLSIMIHVLEQRNPHFFWWDEMQSPEQQAVDTIFMNKANELMDAQLAKLKGEGQTSEPTLQNNFNGWLPSGQTTVTVLAPQWNADYYNTRDAFVFMKQGQYVYPQQVDKLKSTMMAKVIGTDEAMVTDVSYRRRYNPDPEHRSDDRDLAAVAPTPNDGGNEIWAGFYYDDHGFQPIARIGTMLSS